MTGAHNFPKIVVARPALSALKSTYLRIEGGRDTRFFLYKNLVLKKLRLQRPKFQDRPTLLQPEETDEKEKIFTGSCTGEPDGVGWWRKRAGKSFFTVGWW